ncbi:hypothetical protein ACIBHY_29975 [Nonomuraea sp. NPDC050547]|uniref:hypothetical protein n=1 Tax=Nonomuraea sp. NPDC050547 TaxID=3364368 RepID=UPI0037BD5D3F
MLSDILPANRHRREDSRVCTTAKPLPSRAGIVTPGTALALYVLGTNIALILLLRSRIRARRRIDALRVAQAEARLQASEADQETKRLAGQMARLRQALAPIATRARTGQDLVIARKDLAIVAVLVEHDGQEADALVALEDSFNARPL